MAVLREWRAAIRRELRDEYVEYVRSTGVASYQQTPGNLGAIIATRDLDEERTEIVVLSWWVDKAAIKGFAGEEIERARYFPRDSLYLITRPRIVRHYETTESEHP